MIKRNTRCRSALPGLTGIAEAAANTPRVEPSVAAAAIAATNTQALGEANNTEPRGEPSPKSGANGREVEQ